MTDKSSAFFLISNISMTKVNIISTYDCKVPRKNVLLNSFSQKIKTCIYG